MPYARLKTNQIADSPMRELFDRADGYLADVYTMLSSRPLHRTKGGACNLTATLVLLCIVDAMAKYVYPKVPVSGDRAQRDRFRKLVMDKLPWGPESAGWSNKRRAASVLYGEMRNTLTHALGVDRPADGRPTGFVEPTADVWGIVQPKRIGAVDVRKSWPDEWPVLSVLSDARGTRENITVVGLYWAVKRMVQGLADDI